MLSNVIQTREHFEIKRKYFSETSCISFLLNRLQLLPDARVLLLDLLPAGLVEPHEVRRLRPLRLTLQLLRLFALQTAGLDFQGIKM